MSETELKEPIFISANIKKPLFNEEFAKSLSDISEWLKVNYDIQPLTQNIIKLITEIIKLNKQLLSKTSFDKAVPMNIDMDSLTRFEFSSLNSNAMFNEIQYCTYGKNFIPYDNYMLIGKIYRRLQKVNISDSETEKGIKISFLERFFGELLWANYN